MLFLGRNTVLWMGAITAAVQLARVVLPAVDAHVWDALTALLGALIALVAATSTTPTSDPRLPEGASVTLPDGTAATVVRD